MSMFWKLSVLYFILGCSIHRLFVFCSGTVRRFLEKQKDKITAVVFCTTTANDTEIYKRYVCILVCAILLLIFMPLFELVARHLVSPMAL